MSIHRSTPTTPRCSLASPIRQDRYFGYRSPSYGHMRPTSVTTNPPAEPVETVFTLLSRSPYATSNRAFAGKTTSQRNATPNLIPSPSRRKSMSCQRRPYPQSPPQQHYIDQHRTPNIACQVGKQYVQSARATGTLSSNLRSSQRRPTKQSPYISTRQSCSPKQQIAAPKLNITSKTLQNSPWHISSNLASLAEFSSSIFSDDEDPTQNCRVTNDSQRVVTEQPRYGSTGLDDAEEIEGCTLLKRCQHSKDTDATVQSSHTSQTGSNNHADEPLIPALPPGSMQSTELMQYILGVLMAKKSPRSDKNVWDSNVYTLYKRGHS